MADKTFRYRLDSPGVDLEQLRDEIPDATATIDASGGGVIIDIVADETAEDDLTAAMAVRGYSFVEEDPSNTPDQAFFPGGGVQQLYIDSSVNSQSYETLATIGFGGTTVWGTPVEIEMLVRTDDAARPGDVRIIDIDNGGAVVAEFTGFTNEDFDFILMPSINNLAATRVRWEIQAKKNGSGNARTYVETIDIRY